MKLVFAVIATLLIVGCQQGQNAPVTPHGSQAPIPPAVTIDISTPDRALKSYWLAKDTYRKAQFDWTAAQIPEMLKLKSAIGFDPPKFMSSDVLSAHQETDQPSQGQFYEYTREIVDIKQDTESRATVTVKIKNSTPVPEGIVVSDSDKKRREKGEKLKYILEKESDGWKVAQVYLYDEVNIILDKEPWEKVFSAPSERGSANVYVYQYHN